MFSDERKRPSALKLSSRPSSSGSSTESLKQPRTPRFAEATTVHSPVHGKSPFADPEKDDNSSQPGFVGFGYIGKGADDDVPMAPRSPLKSAMKVPGTPGRRFDNPLSPTFREEQILEKQESLTDKEQARDLKIKTRVRMAKFALRGVNFSCSLIVLSMLSASFSIFNATRSLPTQSNFPPWATNTKSWPQKVVLGASIVSLTISVIVFIGYCRGGHRRAEKVSVYYTLFAVGWFIVSLGMWAAAAGVLQFSRNNSNNQDMWGWSCVQNQRSQVFSEKVDYALVCRLQSWSLICIIIEIVVEVISITLYSVVFYRYYSKRKLHKSMDMRDKARSDLYLAQLRTQSAPNTPGFGPKSPSFSQYALSPRFPPQAYRSLGDVEEEDAIPFTPGGRNLVEPKSAFAARSGLSAGSSPSGTSFKLQAPPQKAPSATPKMNGVGFSAPAPMPAPRPSRSYSSNSSRSSSSMSSRASPTPPPGNAENVNRHAPVAPGEVQYAAVPIPGAYAGAALKSPRY
ncbi:hypothetical protein SPBR_04916 [Sporothrix brasiliensis 5110]|uniref:Hyphal anastamosis-8 protein n=1 Tax=Sporothrix brasiliensis 5110 TaxID=1398154 RepID=A0A0C2F922_9PEZI|nr:uncharacterized protein SPBR_04916 [Sporothrix brasiliensis 5110]KIH87598.1 hypothetical protein SPBR_04916 [Sporothrix brasiliensis 5110]